MVRLVVLIAAGYMIWSCGQVASEDKISEASAKTKVHEAAGKERNGEYLAKFARQGIFELELNKLAAEKATRSLCRELAARMVTHHTEINKELIVLAAAKKIKLPSEMSEKKLEKIHALNEKDELVFDKAYLERLIKDHQKSVELLKKIAENTKDADIKEWADKTLPRIQQHLEEAKKIDEMMSDKEPA